MCPTAQTWSSPLTCCLSQWSHFLSVCGSSRNDLSPLCIVLQSAIRNNQWVVLQSYLNRSYHKPSSSFPLRLGWSGCLAFLRVHPCSPWPSLPPSLDRTWWRPPDSRGKESSFCPLPISPSAHYWPFRGCTWWTPHGLDLRICLVNKKNCFSKIILKILFEV